jgi:colanic acid/amylovoran biosynthesis glycosyltransferase
MEAMALGRPIISTYIAGIPELVKPGRTGWLVPASDEIALADAMRGALNAPVDQLANMGAAARRHVNDHHDSMKEAAKLKKLFARSIENKARPE